MITRRPLSIPMEPGKQASRGDLLLVVGRFAEFCPDPVLVIDGNENIVMANDSAVDAFALDPRSLPPVRDVIVDWVAVPRYEGLAGKELFKAMVKKAGGQPGAVELNLFPFSMGGEELTALRLSEPSPDSRKEQVRELESSNASLRQTNELLLSQVRTDFLTELLNRRGLEAALKREVEFARRNDSDLLAVLIDLDNFKMVNETHGHAVGDLVLKHAAGLLKEEIRAVDWLGRIGGDEFLLLLPCTNLGTGAKVAERLRLALSRNPLPTAGGKLKVTGSLGLVTLPDYVSTVGEVLELTREAIKESKLRGKNRVTMVDERKIQLSPDLRGVNIRDVLSESDGFRAFAQPIVRLGDARMVACELLIRGPEGPLEMPDELFSMARQNDILTLADLHSLDTCLARAGQMKECHVFHINIFPSTLTDLTVERLIERLRAAGPGRTFCVEISEKSVLADPTYLVPYVRDLKRQGIKLALDDLGFGFTSLETLIMLEPDFLKIDARMVSGIAADRDRQNIVARLCGIATVIGAAVIAEGVESREDYLCLRSLGVEYGQGYFWGHPC